LTNSNVRSLKGILGIFLTDCSATLGSVSFDDEGTGGVEDGESILPAFNLFCSVASFFDNDSTLVASFFFSLSSLHDFSISKVFVTR